MAANAYLEVGILLLDDLLLHVRPEDVLLVVRHGDGVGDDVWDAVKAEDTLFLSKIGRF